MNKRALFALVALGCLSACHAGPAQPTPPSPNAPIEPLTVPGETFHVSGTVQAPKGYQDQVLYNRPKPFTEVPVNGVQVFLADAKLQPVPGVAAVTTDAQGDFAIDSPQRAGFVVMSKPASASAALMAYYHDGSPTNLDIASTMVAWTLSESMATHSVPIQNLDPTKVAKATQLVHSALVDGSEINPDLSLPSWPAALDFYAYRTQGQIAATLNGLIPGSVPPKGI